MRLFVFFGIFSKIFILFFNSAKTLAEEVKKNMKGKVKWYNPRKGYGFIEGEDGKDVFVHQTDIPTGTYLNDEDRVEYDIEKSEKGPKAKNVKKL